MIYHNFVDCQYNGKSPFFKHKSQVRPPAEYNVKMKIDYSGAELFLACWRGEASLQQVLDHPAYRTVSQHAQLFSDGITARDIENAIRGNPSPFYGLDGLSTHLDQIQALLRTILRNEKSWVATVNSTLSRLLPGEILNITIYPIIGYDMGIGLNGVVCMNCNCESYLAEPYEFLFYIIHECIHVLYERSHQVPQIKDVVSSRQWLTYFNLWSQNEGFAVFAPLQLRQDLGYLRERDCIVLFDKRQLEAHRMSFIKVLDRLLQFPQPTRDEYLDYCFGPMRLTYRIGCELFRHIERAYGMEVAREAFYLDGDSFIAKYRHLIETADK